MPRPGRSRHYYRHDAPLETAGPAGPLTDARRDLAAAYLPLARKLARPMKAIFRHWRDEIESAACLALIEAARDYDPARRIAFATFARFRIRGALVGIGWEMRPVGLDDDRRTVPLTPRLEAHGRVLTAHRPPAVGSEFDDVDAVEGWLRKLPARHREVCRLYYLYGKTMEEVGELIGYSQAGVNRLHRQAIALLSDPYATPAPAAPRRRQNRRLAS